ncbi:hypothetical protein AYI68_g4600 [Smittium mucronatum]|uniref:Uncharacterized protein n=1 Tax=Smittium mucronatum TaxID=133383 RepID=A0A1R0GWM2_9FUNG|nr:hypothetical protein AYI68_g4600 [Smittium mucronatum]
MTATQIPIDSCIGSENTEDHLVQHEVVDIQLLVYSYLTQANYPKTASSFANSCQLRNEFIDCYQNTPSYLVLQSSSKFSKTVSQTLLNNLQTVQFVHDENSDILESKISDNKDFSADVHIESDDISDMEVDYIVPRVLPKEASVSLKDSLWNPGVIIYQKVLSSVRQGLYFPEVVDSTSFNSRFFGPSHFNRAYDSDPSNTINVFLNELALAHKKSFNSLLIRYKLDAQKFVNMLLSKKRFSDALRFSMSTLQFYPVLLKIWADNSFLFETVGELSDSTILENKVLFDAMVMKANNLSPIPQPLSSNHHLTEDTNFLVNNDSKSSNCKSKLFINGKHHQIPTCQDSFPSSTKSSLQFKKSSESFTPTNIFLQRTRHNSCQDTEPEIMSHIYTKLTANEIQTHFNKLCSLGVVPGLDSDNDLYEYNMLSESELAHFLDTSILSSLGYPNTPALVTIINQILVIFNLLFSSTSEETGQKTCLNLHQIFDIFNKMRAGRVA